MGKKWLFSFWNKWEKKHENEFLLKDKSELNKLLRSLYKNEYYFSGEKDYSNFYKKANDIWKRIIILEYYKNWEHYTYIFLNEEKENWNFQNLNNKDFKLFEEVIKSWNKYAVIIIWINRFVSFLDDLYWYSPIEYYLRWKESIEKNIDKYEIEYRSPYNFVMNKINKEIKEDWYEIIISHKEKFWSWVFNWMVIKKDWKDIMELEGCILYKIYYFFKKYIEEYNEKYIYVSYDYENEWEYSFWIKERIYF